jgi:hypothetical protein
MVGSWAFCRPVSRSSRIHPTHVEYVVHECLEEEEKVGDTLNQHGAQRKKGKENAFKKIIYIRFFFFLFN